MRWTDGFFRYLQNVLKMPPMESLSSSVLAVLFIAGQLRWGISIREQKLHGRERTRDRLAETQYD